MRGLDGRKLVILMFAVAVVLLVIYYGLAYIVW
jgi:hypothetical protein